MLESRRGTGGACLRLAAAITLTAAALGTFEAKQSDAQPRTLEDIYGPTGDTFQAALGFRVFEGDSIVHPTTSYGVGVDDMRFSWREYKLVEDATDCATSGSCASIVVDAGIAYGGTGTFHIRVVDASPYGMAAPFDRNDCNRNGAYVDGVDDTDCDDNGTPDVVLTISSLPEPTGELVVANRVSTGVYEAECPYSATVNVPGVLLIEDGGPNNNDATIQYEDRWDGSASGQKCQNSSNPANQGFVTEGVQIEMVTGSVVVISSRLVETNGDLDGYPDTNETVDLYLTVANKTNQQLTNVAVQVSSSDPKIDCVLSSLAIIPSLDPKGSANAIKETPTSIRLHVAAPADRGGTTPAVSCTGGQCSNGAGACVSAATCAKTVFDDYSARLNVAISADSIDVGSLPQAIFLDLDLNAAGPVVPTSTFVEGFEAGFGNFTFMNLDQNIASNSASNGARCQYNDPDYPNSNSYADTECYLGFRAGQNPVNGWHVHTTSAPDGGRAYTGIASLHYGRHTPGNPGNDTYDLSQLDAIRTKVNVNLAARVCQNDPAPGKRACNSTADCVVVGGGPCSSASPVFTFKHQISTTDSRSTGTPAGQAADRAVVHAQITGPTIWQKLSPYENTYDVQGTDNFSNCIFDPTDDGNDEDDFFDPTDPNRRLGPSSTCFPEFVFSFIGDTDAAFNPTFVGRAGDGPGLQGSLGIGTWIESKVDLSRYRGRLIRLRYVFTTIKVSDLVSLQDLFMWNPAPYDDGWYVDDVRVTQTLGTSSATAALDAVDNSGLTGCPATACTTLTPSLVLTPSGGSSPGKTVELSATASTADRCVNGALLYRFFLDADASGTFSAGDTVLRSFGTSSVQIEAPTATTRYGVTVKCSTGGTGACTGGDATATFTLSCGPPAAIYDAALWWTRVRWTNKTTLTAPPFGEITDAVRGSLDLLRSTGSFASSGATCLANNAAPPSFTDASAPATGSGFYYLLRGQVLCNDSTSYGTFSTRENPGNPGKRDAEISACPP